MGLILPHSIYNEREYIKAVSQSLAEILPDTKRSRKKQFKFLEKFQFGNDEVHRIMMKVNPSPTRKLQFEWHYMS